MTTFTNDLMDRIADFGRATKSRLRGGQEGAISAEYVAILLVVAGIVAVIIGLNLDEKVGDCGDAAQEAMFSDDGADPSC